MSRTRFLRVAELVQADEDDVRAVVTDLPRATSATVSALRSGVLLTLQHRRPWWDRRPRRFVLAVLQRRLDGMVEAAARTVVVGAAIERDGVILAAQRERPVEMAGKWEFPGGKAELGESPTTALVRECREELGVEVVVGDELGRVQLPSGARLIVLRAVLADPSQEPQALEHRRLRWCKPSDLPTLDWLEHDAGFAQALARRDREG